MEESLAGYGFDGAIELARRGEEFRPPPTLCKPLAGHRGDEPRRESRCPAPLVVHDEHRSLAAQERPAQRRACQPLTDDCELRGLHDLRAATARERDT